jgi:hypothetical protein
VPEVLVNETEGLFVWQFDGGGCPAGCAKEEEEEGEKGWCVKQVEDEEEAGGKVGGKKESVRDEL